MTLPPTSPDTPPLPPAPSAAPEGLTYGAAASAPSRDTAFDVFKGLAILAVLLHHFSGATMRQTMPGSTSRFGIAFLNRGLLFCVPAFLFLTVFLLTRSLLRRPLPVADFWRKRFPRILVPYLLWTGFYALWNVALGITARRDLLRISRWEFWLLYGKANFHLYFLVIVLQIYIFLPDLVRSFRERETGLSWKWIAGATGLKLFASASLLLTLRASSLGHLFQEMSFVALLGVLYISVRETGGWALSRRDGLALWFLLALGLQVSEYWANKLALHTVNPGVMAYSYYLPILLAIWIAFHEAEFRAGWPRSRWILGPLTLIALAGFTPVAMRMAQEQPVNPFLYQAGYWIYTGLACLWLFGVSAGLATRWRAATAALAFLGGYSMEIYLIHPALLALFTRAPFHGTVAGLALHMIGVTVAVTGATLLLAMALRRANLGGLLFGR